MEAALPIWDPNHVDARYFRKAYGLQPARICSKVLTWQMIDDARLTPWREALEYLTSPRLPNRLRDSRIEAVPTPVVPLRPVPFR